MEDGAATGSYGGGLRIYSEIGSARAGGFSCNVIDKHHFVTVINTTFLNNKGQGGSALSIEQVDGNIVCVNRIVMFENCGFTNNTSTNGFAVYIGGARLAGHAGVKFNYNETFSLHLSSQHTDVFYNCTFSNSAIAQKQSLGETCSCWLFHYL